MRERGWYWVKVAQSPDWECGKWRGDGWDLINDKSDSLSDHVYAVGPRVLSPDELEQLAYRREPGNHE